MEDLEQFNLETSSFGFSAAGIDDLEATEYTIVTIAVDTSSSVNQFKNEIENCLKSVIDACRKSPRSDNLMIRLVKFDNTVQEVHGFKELQNCNPNDYDNCIMPRGLTALVDATVNAVEAASVYGKMLVESDYECNGLLIVITDGMDNRSTNTINQCKEALSKVTMNEHIDGGLHTILVGVNVNNHSVSKYLNDYKDQVGFKQYVELNNADANTLAKLANWISKSVSAQSQALATGGPSQSISF
jgi:uncharacterized protein YegL